MSRGVAARTRSDRDGLCAEAARAAGVRVFFYLEDRERTLDSPTDKIMLSLTAFADELEREKARQRTYDAMIRKARAGPRHRRPRASGIATSRFAGADGNVARTADQRDRPKPRSSRRIFRALRRRVRRSNGDRQAAQRGGRTGTAGATGRPRAGRRRSVRAMLHRPLYRGVVRGSARASGTAGASTVRAPGRASEWKLVPGAGAADRRARRRGTRRMRGRRRLARLSAPAKGGRSAVRRSAIPREVSAAGPRAVRRVRGVPSG